MASLHDGAGDVQVVDVRNGGALPDLPPTAVVEVPARIDRGGAHPLPLSPLAPDMRGLVQRPRVRGADDRGRDLRRPRTALRALMANPLVPDFTTARDLLAAMLEANRGHLPRFFAE